MCAVLLWVNHCVAVEKREWIEDVGLQLATPARTELNRQLDRLYKKYSVGVRIILLPSAKKMSEDAAGVLARKELAELGDRAILTVVSANPAFVLTAVGNSFVRSDKSHLLLRDQINKIFVANLEQNRIDGAITECTAFLDAYLAGIRETAAGAPTRGLTPPMVFLWLWLGAFVSIPVAYFVFAQTRKEQVA